MKSGAPGLPPSGTVNWGERIFVTIAVSNPNRSSATAALDGSNRRSGRRAASRASQLNNWGRGLNAREAALWF